jgi:competence protein ComEA
VEWIKTQLTLAKTGDKKARQKLLLLLFLAIVVAELLISGQSTSEPIRVNKTKQTSTLLTTSNSQFIHIVGEVKNPGVYPISAGTRLFEVIAEAGGFTSSADRASVNLARTVTDGEQVIVSSLGKPQASDGLIHLNLATASDFDKLPGIGPTLAGRIVDWRHANGSFKTVDDLRRVGGIGDKLFAAIKSLVVL